MSEIDKTKKNNKHKTHKHYTDAPRGTTDSIIGCMRACALSQGRIPLVPGTNGTKQRIYCAIIKQKTANLSQGQSLPVSGTAPVCARDRSGVSQGRVPFLPDTVPPKMFKFIAFSCPKFGHATGKYGCTEVRVYPAECGEQLGRDPLKYWSSKCLVLKRFSGEGTHWDLFLLVSLILWDTPVLLRPHFPSPRKKRTKNQPKVFLHKVFLRPVGSWTSAPLGYFPALRAMG